MKPNFYQCTDRPTRSTLTAALLEMIRLAIIAVCTIKNNLFQQEDTEKALLSIL
jgi:hypothetical protein